jgi:hypothetical protein
VSDVWQWKDKLVHSVKTDGLVDPALIEVHGEQPVTKTGVELPSFGNRYYPTMVRLWIAGRMRDNEPDDVTLLAEDARLIGHALLEAADIAEATDKLDSAACGHWVPCSCGGAA